MNRIALALAGIAGLAVQPATAVQLSRSGAGQVLIFPYFIARPSASAADGESNTLISIVNTKPQFKAVKVRVLESRNARELRDINVFLGPWDIWTTAIIPTATGARLVTNDNTCVTPRNMFSEPGLDSFTNASYSGVFADGDPFGAGSTTLDRTREGYIEVIEMGVVTTPQTQAFIKHGTNGIPANCAALDALDPGIGTGGTSFPTGLSAPSGGLNGRATIINSALGINFTYTATALDNWSDSVRYGAAGSGQPRLGAASPPVSTIVLPNGDTLRQTWASGRDAVSAVLMRSAVNNEFILDAGTASQTDWIITFPTKRDYIGIAAGATAPIPQAPFSSNFGGFGACDETIAGSEGYQGFNREGVPLLAAPTSLRLCWVSNIIPFFSNISLLRATAVAPHTNAMQTALAGATTQGGPATSVPGGVQGGNGRMTLRFGTAAQRMTPISSTLNNAPTANTTLVGMPFISLGVHNYRRSGVISNYGGVIAPVYEQAFVK
ncbi:MAG: hypothetical protein JNN20_09925 [Betaproteobacteria bacterium]|nr:hypothetical protein [Betaproteobacteria bacterium]